MIIINSIQSNSFARVEPRIAKVAERLYLPV